MRFSRQRPHNPYQPTLLTLLIGAPASLYTFSAWIDAGGATPVFWRQALLIASVVAVAGAGTWWRSRRHHGAPARISLLHGRRLADLLTLLGLLLLAVLLWMEVRRVAAVDAPSLGRTVIALGVAWGMLAGVVLQAAHLPVAQGWEVRRLNMAELSVILQLSVVVILLLPANPPAGITAWPAAVQTTGVALFVGQIALQALRRPGVAIMVAAAVLFHRALANFALAQQPGAAEVGAAVQFLALAPAGALDMAYAVRQADADARRSLYFALAAGVGAALTAALIFWPQLAGVPALTPAITLFVCAPGAALGLACGWCGAAFGHAARKPPSD